MSLNVKQAGWKDLVSDIHSRGSGATDPAFTEWRTGMRAYEFPGSGSLKEVWLSFHLLHDLHIPPGGAGAILYPHVHFINSSGGGTGDVKFLMDWCYAKGHNQAAMTAPATISVVQTISGTQYRHQIAEYAAGIQSVDFETDGILMLRVYRDPGDAADTCTASVWLLFVDLHYLADHETTPNKAPSFF
jgi:hypothetical protein